VFDPYADNAEFEHEYGVSLTKEVGKDYDAVIIAVNHDQFATYDEQFFLSILKPDGIVADVKGELRNKIKHLRYWSL
jgi:UDP-N-acetyl-D-galactosamine dehydrogenase